MHNYGSTMKFTLSILWLFCLVCSGNAETWEDFDHGELLHRVRRVIGGQNAAQGAWPWMGSLRSADGQHMCGAILLSEQSALTAAHCNEGTPVVTIVLGETALNSPNPTTRNFQFIPHPNYDSDTLENDIALLWFNQPVPFNQNIQPASIAQSRDEMNTHTDCTITGWGLVSQVPAPQLPNILQVGDVNIYTGEQCANGFENPLYSGNSMICGGNLAGGISTCAYDSGGPLQCRNANNEYEIVGITSFFFHRATGLCAQPNNPHVFTRVSSYLEFISQKHGADAPQSFSCPADIRLFDVPNTGVFVIYTNPTCIRSDGSTGAVTCTPGSASQVDVPSVVTCTCVDLLGNTCDISCLVEREDLPPVIGSCPTDINLVPTGGGQTIITYTSPVCNDDEEGLLPVDCIPTTSLTLVTSPRQIRCTCIDSAGSTAAVTCAVDGRLTALSCPPTVVVVDGIASWTPPDCVINGVVVGVSVCTPTSGISIPETVVDCICFNSGQLDTCTFDVFPVGNEPPEIVSCPTNIQTFQRGDGQTVITYANAICTDPEDITATVVCTPTSGAPVFALNQISCTCTDLDGATVTRTCQGISDGNLPEIGPCPTTIQLVQVGGGQSVVVYALPTCVANQGDGTATVVCNPASGIPVFSPNEVSCTCTDSIGAIDSITCPVDGLGALPCPPAVNRIGIAFLWTPPSCEVNGNIVGVSVCTPPPGTTNQGIVNCVCTNGGQQDTCSFPIIDDACNPNRCVGGLECRIAAGQPGGYTCHSFSGQECV